MRCALGFHAWRRVAYPLTTEEQAMLDDGWPVHAYFYRVCTHCEAERKP